MVTRLDFIKAVAKRAGFTQVDTKAVFDAAEKVVLDILQDGEGVKIGTALTLDVKDVPARTYRNPQTGESAVSSAKKKPVAKFGKSIKDALN